MRMRFTLGALMGLVVLAAFSMSVLRDPAPFWSSALFTLDVILLGFATLGAVARRGSARMPWAGFAGFGWSYLALSFGPLGDKSLAHAPPDFLTSWIFDQLSAFSNGRPTRVVTAGFPAFIVIEFRQISHSLSAILFALLGGLLGRLAVPREERTTEPGGR
jgi:hypothetical protein